jgi:hypothetical protein
LYEIKTGKTGKTNLFYQPQANTRQKPNCQNSPGEVKMTSKKQQKQIFLAALDLYVTWLNSFHDAADPTDNEHPYTAKDFTEGYGRYTIVSCNPAANADLVLHVSLTDGDEGGPHDLIFGWHESDNTIKFILQGFDTLWCMIYNDGEFDLKGFKPNAI